MLQLIPKKQELQEESDYLTENRRLEKELEEMKKGNAFLHHRRTLAKKAVAFFAKEID